METNTLNSAAPTATPDNSTAFMKTCRDLVTRENITFSQAATRISCEQPGLYQDHLQANAQERPPGCRRSHPAFLAAGQLRAREKNISLANALSEIAGSMPWLYEGDFPEKSATTTATEEAPAQASSQPGDDDDDEVSEYDARVHRGRQRARDYRLAFERGDKKAMGRILLASAAEDRLQNELEVLCA